jgi:cytochrome b
VPQVRRTGVWDLPLRLFHWALVFFVIAACVSAKLGGDAALRAHFFSGYCALTLIVFRLLWGFCGTHHALFSTFVRRPAVSLEFLRGKNLDAKQGHNPLGGLAVLGLLAVTGTIAVSGLFTNDEIASEGPLARFVSEAAVHRFSSVHAWCEIALYAIVAVHLIAIAFYRAIKKRDLVGPMITGYSCAPSTASDTEALDPNARDVNARAALLFAICTALVAFIATLVR